MRGVGGRESVAHRLGNGAGVGPRGEAQAEGGKHTSLLSRSGPCWASRSRALWAVFPWSVDRAGGRSGLSRRKKWRRGRPLAPDPCGPGAGLGAGQDASEGACGWGRGRLVSLPHPGSLDSSFADVRLLTCVPGCSHPCRLLYPRSSSCSGVSPCCGLWPCPRG